MPRKSCYSGPGLFHIVYLSFRCQTRGAGRDGKDAAQGREGGRCALFEARAGEETLNNKWSLSRFFGSLNL